MNILGFDTSTETLSLALKTAKTGLGLSLQAGYKHAESLVPWIDRGLRQLDLKARELDLIVITVGPGSFTGLRIGLATAKGLAMGAGCALTGIATLDVLAAGVPWFEGLILPVLDARKQRIYCALYHNLNGSQTRITDFLDISPEALPLQIPPGKPVMLTGPGATEIYRQCRIQLKKNPVFLHGEYSFINPYTIIELGIKLYKQKGDQSAAINPLYLRKSEAEISRLEKDI